MNPRPRVHARNEIARTCFARHAWRTHLWHHLFTLTEAENFSFTGKVNKRFYRFLARKTSSFREAYKGRNSLNYERVIINRWIRFQESTCISLVEIFSAGFQDKLVFLPCLMGRANCYNCSWRHGEEPWDGTTEFVQYPKTSRRVVHNLRGRKVAILRFGLAKRYSIG